MEGTYAKITFDRQIVTIAKVNGAHTIYSDDENVGKFSKRCGIAVVKTWELPLPDVEQPSLLSVLEKLESQIVDSEDQAKEELLTEAEETTDTNDSDGVSEAISDKESGRKIMFEDGEE